jgi:hypothetical protein
MTKEARIYMEKIAAMYLAPARPDYRMTAWPMNNPIIERELELLDYIETRTMGNMGLTKKGIQEIYEGKFGSTTTP